jgi:plastocyanin
VKHGALATVAIGLLVLPGCGSSESGFASIPDVGERFPGEVQADARIDMREIEFTPVRVRVAAGSTVTWVNRDSVAHTVVKGTDTYNEFTSGEVAPGATYTRTFDEPGEVEYRCTIHASMEGALSVER